MIELELLAFVASGVGCLSFAPQIVKILRTQQTLALSYSNYFLVSLSSFLWIFFGLITPIYSIVFWNSVFGLLALSIIFLKYFNEKDIHSNTLN